MSDFNQQAPGHLYFLQLNNKEIFPMTTTASPPDNSNLLDTLLKQLDVIVTNEEILRVSFPNCFYQSSVFTIALEYWDKTFRSLFFGKCSTIDEGITVHEQVLTVLSKCHIEPRETQWFRKQLKELKDLHCTDSMLCHAERLLDFVEALPPNSKTSHEKQLLEQLLHLDLNAQHWRLNSVLMSEPDSYMRRFRKVIERQLEFVMRSVENGTLDNDLLPQAEQIIRNAYEPGMFYPQSASPMFIHALAAFTYKAPDSTTRIETLLRALSISKNILTRLNRFQTVSANRRGGPIEIEFKCGNDVIPQVLRMRILTLNLLGKINFALADDKEGKESWQEALIYCADAEDLASKGITVEIPQHLVEEMRQHCSGAQLDD